MQSVRYILAVVLVTLGIAGCPGQPTSQTPDNTDNPSNVTTPVEFTDPQTAAASVKLPAGVNIDPGALKALTNVEDATVDASGNVNPQLISNHPSFVPLVNADGKAVLLAFLTPSGGEFSARSTAATLLYFAIGAFTAPVENAQNILDRIAASDACTQLAAAIEAAMLVNPTAITDGDPGITAAILAGQQMLLNDETPGTSSKAIRQAKSPLVRQQDANDPAAYGISLTPGSDVYQSGMQVLQNPDGAGIVAQNNFRRRAVMLSYLVGTKDTAGNLTEVNPPQLVGAPVTVPTTLELGLIASFKQAGQNLVGTTPVAPWTPIRSGVMTLPMQGGAAQTLYKVVVLGAALDVTGVSGPMLDSKFATLWPEWNQKVADLNMETFVYDFLYKVIEYLGVGAAGTANEAQKAAALAKYRLTLDPWLLSKGLPVPLATHEAFRASLKASLTEIGEAAAGDETILKKGTVSFLMDNWEVTQASKVKLEKLQANLARAARIGALLTAIDAAMGVLDLGAIFHDLTSSAKSDGWDAIVVPRTIRLDPTNATVTPSSLTVSITATVNGDPYGDFLFRWTTTGARGQIHSYQRETSGNTFDTVKPENNIFYVANAASLQNGTMDTVDVEVFVNDGTGVISDKTPRVGTARCTIAGSTSDVSISPATVTVKAGDTVTFTIKAPDNFGAGLHLWYDWTLTKDPLAHTTAPMGLINNETYDSGSDRTSVTYVAGEDTHTGVTDTLQLEIYNGGNVIATATATIAGSLPACENALPETVNSGCSNITLSKNLLHPGEEFTATVSYQAITNYCGGPYTIRANQSNAFITSVDGIPVSGEVTSYEMPEVSYNNTYFTHTVTLRLAYWALDACPSGDYWGLNGPWVVLRGGNTIAAAPFVIRYGQ